MTFNTFILTYLYCMSWIEMYQIHRLESQMNDAQQDITLIKENINMSGKDKPLLKKDLIDARAR